MKKKRTFTSSNRREFLARSALIASSALIARDALAEAPLEALGEDEPIAIALGYAADANNVDTVKYPKRAGEAGQQQYCSNCSLYKAASNEGYGKCTAIAGKLVAGAGWCNAWIPG